jgi:hypothetical protein
MYNITYLGLKEGNKKERYKKERRHFKN